jgi:sec-independent protein translocase protein TatA
MGLDNPIHIAFLLVVLLLVFGAKRLPEMGHSLGSGLRGFRDALSGDGRTAAAPAPLAAPDAAPAAHLAAAPPALGTAEHDALVAAPAADAAALTTVSGNASSHEPMAAA